MKKHTKTDTEIAKTDICLFFRVIKDIIKKRKERCHFWKININFVLMY